MLSLDEDTEQTRDVETEGESGGAAGFLIDQHVGNATLQGEGEGGDFALVQVAVSREDWGNGGGLCERDECRKNQPGEPRVRGGFLLKFEPDLARRGAAQ